MAGTVVLSPAWTLTAGGVNVARGYDTAQNVINQAAGECGLTVPANNNPFTSTDPSMGRMVTLLRSCGAELMKSYEWQSKLIIYTLTTGTNDPGQYTLPADFECMIDQTGWQKSYFWPLRGPYSAQMWQRVVNYPTTGIYVAFRIQGNQLWLWPQPVPSNIGITFIYKSRAWVLSLAGTYQEMPTAATDTLNFDWLMLSKLLKLRYLESIGHDTTAAERQFRTAWDSCTDQEQAAAPELELAKDSRFPFITGFNSPDTGFGGQPPAGGSYQ